MPNKNTPQTGESAKKSTDSMWQRADYEPEPYISARCEHFKSIASRVGNQYINHRAPMSMQPSTKQII